MISHRRAYLSLLSFTLIALLQSVLISAEAQAQRAATLWVVDGSPREAQEHESALTRVFGGPRSPTHIVGRAGIEDASRHGALRVPGCLDGTRECSLGVATVMQALGADIIVRIQVEAPGVVHAVALNEDGEELQRLRGEGRSTQAAMASVVSQLTGATGTLIVDSTPRGARVLLNGNDVGATPFSRSVAVGAWEVSVALPGWAANDETIVIPPDGTGQVHFQMERSSAALTVRSGTPGAYVIVGGDTRHNLNDKIWLEPGAHEITVAAPGYDPHVQTMSFEAGVDRELRATLYISRAEQTRRRIRDIQARPLMVQAGFRYSNFSSDWSTARIFSPHQDRVTCATLEDGRCARQKIHGYGLDLEAIYSLKILEFAPLGVSIYGLASPSSTTFSLRDEGVHVPNHDRARRIQFRLAHVGARYLINEYFEPYGRAGFTLGNDRLRMIDEASGTTYKARRFTAQLELRVGARAHINQLLYAYAELGAGFELAASRSTPSMQMAVGVGVNLNDPLKFSERTRREREVRRAERERIPEEL